MTGRAMLPQEDNFGRASRISTRWTKTRRLAYFCAGRSRNETTAPRPSANGTGADEYATGTSDPS
jgi:hypothetical protein